MIYVHDGQLLVEFLEIDNRGPRSLRGLPCFYQILEFLKVRCLTRHLGNHAICPLWLEHSIERVDRRAQTSIRTRHVLAALILIGLSSRFDFSFSSELHAISIFAFRLACAAAQEEILLQISLHATRIAWYFVQRMILLQSSHSP